MSQPRIFFIGASTVEGMGDETRQGWPGRLLALEDVRLSGAVTYNLGVRGQTSSEIARRWQSEVTSRLAPEGPVLILLSTGINDTAMLVGGPRRVPLAKTLRTAEAIARAARDIGNVLWVGPFPIDDGQMPYRADSGMEFDFSNERIAELNQALGMLTRTLDIDYVDVFSPLADDPRWLRHFEGGDGLHPTGAGYQELAERVAASPGWLQALDRLPSA